MSRTNHDDVIEEEDLPLVQTQLLFLAGVCHLIQPTVTYQPAVKFCQLLRDGGGWFGGVLCMHVCGL